MAISNRTKRFWVIYRKDHKGKGVYMAIPWLRHRHFLHYLTAPYAVRAFTGLNASMYN